MKHRTLPIAISLLSFGALLVDAIPASANVRFSTSTYNSIKTTDAFIDGDIKKEDVEIFAKGVSNPQLNVREIFLNSRGGDAYAAMDIGRLVRKHGLNTLVSVPSMCLSSCALIYIAGVRAGLGNLHSGISGVSA